MCNNDLMSDFTVREATIFNQVIKKIKTGKYQPEQYSNFIGEHIDQHPTLKIQKSSETSSVKTTRDFHTGNVFFVVYVRTNYCESAHMYLAFYNFQIVQILLPALLIYACAFIRLFSPFP